MTQEKVNESFKAIRDTLREVYNNTGIIRIAPGSRLWGYISYLEDYLAENFDKIEKYDKALEGLEEIGWPCRLVELPAHYKILAKEVSKLKEKP